VDPAVISDVDPADTVSVGKTVWEMVY
jgi:hypothetical protein